MDRMAEVALASPLASLMAMTLGTCDRLREGMRTDSDAGVGAERVGERM